MKVTLYTITYALILGTVSALILAGTGELTAPYREANARADRIQHVLNVLNISHPADASPREITDLFEEKLEEREVNDRMFYQAEDDDAVALPFSGTGLWGPIEGFLALESDLKTIRGVTFYEQQETPGLGGEIAADWFRDQFVEKKIVDEDGKLGINVTREQADEINEVDAITGATMTSDKVQLMINEALRKNFGEVTDDD